MCQMCTASMKTVRVLLAQKIVGLLPKEDNTMLEETVEEVIKDHCQKIGNINIDEGIKVYGCPDLRHNLIEGIRRALPKLTIEERFEMALAAGAVKL
jgi:hypothetical protein